MTVEAHLWRALREHLAERGTVSLLDFACDCANAAARALGGAFHTDLVALADRLASIGVLVRLTTGRYRFRHERLRDYFVAYDSVVRREESLPELLSRVPPARTKTIIPWMIQIADCECPSYLDRVFTEAFDKDVIPSTFPRQAFVHAFAFIIHPTIPLALAVWRVAVEQDDVRWRHDSLCAEVPKTQEWAKAFWDASVFDLAAKSTAGTKGYDAAQNVLDLIPLLPQTCSEHVLTWIGDLQTPPPSLTGICAVLLKAPSPQFRDGMSKVIGWWEEADQEISLGELDQIKQSYGTLVKRLFDLVERLEIDGEHRMAIRLVTVATAPILKPRNWSNSPEDCFLTARYRDTFMPPYEDDQKCYFARKLRLPPADLVGIFRGHIRSLSSTFALF